MATGIETVTSFLDACGQGKAAMQTAFRTYFTPATVWENVGVATTTGIDEALALMANFESAAGAATFRAETLAIAEIDGRVLTERVDYLVSAEGTDLKTIRLMGVFEVADGKILAWRDYFDSAVMA